MRQQGKRSLITGPGRRRATAKLFACEEARVMVSGYRLRRPCGTWKRMGRAALVQGDV
jgi:hypothetical protein